MTSLRRAHRRGEEPEGPSIRVLRLPGTADAALRELLAGIEEEGVPAIVRAPDETVAPAADIAAAAHVTACASTLRVGVVLAPAAACVQLAALPPDATPLLHRSDPTPDALRRLGHDAARLVKTVPLTPSPTDPTPDRSLR